MLLYSLPFIAAGLPMLAWALNAFFGKMGIEITRDGLTYTRSVLFISRRRTVPLVDVGECMLEEGRETPVRLRYDWGYGYRSRRASAAPGRLTLDIGAQTLRFGENLSAREREWLRDAINDELRKARALTGT
jgi:hypothetical protein